MAREHLALASAMKLQLIFVISKSDLVSQDTILNGVVLACENILRSCGRESSVIDTVSKLKSFITEEKNWQCSGQKPSRKVPVFITSNVSGDGLPLLKQYLFLVKVGAPACADNTNSAEKRILILDHFRLDPLVGEHVEGTHPQSLISAGSLSPSAALERMCSETQFKGPQHDRHAEASMVILFGSIQIGSVCVGDEVDNFDIICTANVSSLLICSCCMGLDPSVSLNL